MGKAATSILTGAMSFVLNLFGISVASPATLSFLNPLGDWVKGMLAKLPMVGGFLGGLETKWVVAGIFIVALWIFASWLVHVLGDAKGLIIGIGIGVIILLIWSGMLWNFLPKPSTNSTLQLFLSRKLPTGT